VERQKNARLQLEEHAPCMCMAFFYHMDLWPETTHWYRHAEQTTGGGAYYVLFPFKANEPISPFLACVMAQLVHWPLAPLLLLLLRAGGRRDDRMVPPCGRTDNRLRSGNSVWRHAGSLLRRPQRLPRCVVRCFFSTMDRLWVYFARSYSIT
jgi:hypothetical protein